MGKYSGFINNDDAYYNIRLNRLEKKLRKGFPARSLEASSVDGGAVTVKEILTNPGVGMPHFRNTDTFTGPGPHMLTYVPIDGSEHVVWGIPQPADEWSRDGRTLTLLEPAIKPDDPVQVSYAYDQTGQPAEAEITTLVDFGTPGWSYKQVALTDATDYSAPDFDDSAWTVGQAAFGNNTALGPTATLWNVNTSLWLRRALPNAADLTITVKVEDNCSVYVNGTLVGTAPPSVDPTEQDWYEPGFVVAVPDEVLATQPAVIAIRCNDEAEVYTPDSVYADIQVTGRLIG